MTKEELEKLFGVKFFYHEVKLINAMLEAHRKGKRLTIYPPGASVRKIIGCMSLYKGLKDNIKIDYVFFDEYIGDYNGK